MQVTSEMTLSLLIYLTIGTLPLTYSALSDMAITFLFYFIIGSFGAFLKDLYETMTKKNERIRLGEVIIGGACSTFICYGLQDTWLEGLSINLIVLITFICGILGFELFGNLTTMTRLKRTINAAIELKKMHVTYNDPNRVANDDEQKKPARRTRKKTEEE